MVTVSYPGVYVQEVASGVHTITGVATSIAAFFGRTKKGPLDKAVRVLSMSDFTRTFGGAHPDSDLAQSVRQFFDNGGTDCYVVRLAAEGTAQKAGLTLNNVSGTAVLDITAKSAGLWGNGIRILIDYATPNPDESFNLYVSLEEQGETVDNESFLNLSMDPHSPRFAPTVVSQTSGLIDAALAAPPFGVDENAWITELEFATTSDNGFSQSRRPFVTTIQDNAGDDLRGQLTEILSDGGNLSIEVNGVSANVEIPGTDFTGLDPTIITDVPEHIRGVIETAINDRLNSYGVSVDCSWDVIRSEGTDPEADPELSVLRVTTSTDSHTSVRVRRARANDLAGPLMLGVDQGGIEVTRYSGMRPVPNGLLFAGHSASDTYPESVDLLAGRRLSEVDGFIVDSEPFAFDDLDFLLTDTYMYQDPGGGSDGLRQRLDLIAQAITQDSNLPWRGVRWGYHLALLRIEGLLNDSGTLVFDGSSLPADLDGILLNVRSYTLGTVGTSVYQTIPGTVGLDGDPPDVPAYVGEEDPQTGFYALDSVDLFNLMIIPGDRYVTESQFEEIYAQASTYCQAHRAFLLIDAPASWVDSDRRPAFTESDANNMRALVESDHCAVFYPRVQFSEAGVRKWIGPSGMIAGLMARTDANRGVWKAPAGKEANLRGALDLEVNLTDKENGVLNLAAVNCIRQFPDGIINWGARTLDGFASSTTEWRYISIRRFSLFLQESLYRGTKWVVFEPNDEPLWAQIRLNLNAFMMGLFRQGAFQGSTPDKAFFVKCDGETTTQNYRNQGIVNIEVGFAPLKPAEFVVIRIQQMAGELG